MLPVSDSHTSLTLTVMSEYEIRPGGSLKLKGGVAEGGIVKKKKKKSKSKVDSERDKERQRVKDLLFREEEDSKAPSGSERNSPAASSSASKKTEAEQRFEEVQKRRLAERVAKMATKTHKDRVNEFNAHLESLSEHHDIPKVGPG
ncbi:Protein FAM32A [Hypsizygus marmoreus]|uniref:Protein FAM32A n=1 Tax=Hypsizygus marmoreus TaxID=39966 RepID=A0A369K363_HYPMA|nr:Protein FAM32A [Hypsizygus marmoreus]